MGPPLLAKCTLASRPIPRYRVHGAPRSSITPHIEKYAVPCSGAHCDCLLLSVERGIYMRNLSMTSMSRGRAIYMTADVRRWHVWARQWQTVRDSCERASFCSASSAQTGAGVKATSHVKTRYVQSSMILHKGATRNVGGHGIAH